MEPYEGSSWWERVGLSVRFRLRSGVLRLWGGWLQIFQTAVAACVAWFLAVLIFGLTRPTFAPIAAVISLGLAAGERGRRAFELTLGVAFGSLSPTCSGLSSVSGRCRLGLWWCWRWRWPCYWVGKTSA